MAAYLSEIFKHKSSLQENLVEVAFAKNFLSESRHWLKIDIGRLQLNVWKIIILWLG